MKIKFLSVGKIKERYYVNLIEKNIKLLRKHAEVEVIELIDEKCPEKLSEKEMIQVKNKEGQRILAKIDDIDYVIALAIEGKHVDDNALVKVLTQDKPLTIVIGGSLGLSKEVLNRSNFKLSFSNMTLPHQMMKAILIEKVLESVKRIK